MHRENYSFFKFRKISIQVLGFIWFILGLLLLFEGTYYIYKYSNPYILWFSMIPITIAYSKIVGGILCLILGFRILRKKSLDSCLLFYCFPLIFYLFSSILQFGFFSSYWLLSSLIFLILLWLSITHLRVKNLILSFKQLINNKGKIIIILVISILPNVLSIVSNYDSFSFLH